jgi:hypothetical protein
MHTYETTELRFNEDYSLWVETKVTKRIEIENLEFNWSRENYLPTLGILFASVIFLVPDIVLGFENESSAIRVSRYGKELPNFFKRPPEKILPEFTNPIIVNNSTSINPLNLIVLLLSIFSSLKNLQHNKALLQHQQIEKLQIIQNKKTLEAILLSGGQVVASVSLISSSIIIIFALLSVYLSRKKEIKQQIKQFGRKNIAVVLIELAAVILSVLISDSKSGIETLKHLALHPTVKLILINLLQCVVVFGVLGISGYYTLSPSFSKAKPFLNRLLDVLQNIINTSLGIDPELDRRLAKLQKDIAISKIKKARREREDKVLPTEHFLEKTYQRKIDVGTQFEFERRLRLAEKLVEQLNESFSENQKDFTSENSTDND